MSYDRRRCGRETRWRERKRKRKTGGSRKHKGFPLQGRKGILHVSGLCGAESGEDVLQKLVGGFVLTFHFVHGGLNGADTVHVDWLVLDHIGGRHGGDW